MTNDPGEVQRARQWSKLFVIGLVGLFVFGMLGFALAVIDTEPEPSAPPAPSLPAVLDLLPSPSPTPAVEAASYGFAQGELEPSSAPAEAASPEPSASSAPSLEVASAPTESLMPVVPVAGFWSKAEGLKRAKLKRALVDGELKGYRRVVVEKRIADALAAQLAIDISADVKRVSAERVAKAVSNGALGVVAATSLGPSMRALDLNGVPLHGNERVKDLADWPLTVTMEPLPEDAWD